MQNNQPKGVLRAEIVLDAGAFINQIKLWAKALNKPVDFTCKETTARAWSSFKLHQSLNN
jgi:glutamine synthetase